MKNGIKPEVKVVEVNANINDEVFTGKVLELLDDITKDHLSP